MGGACPFGKGVEVDSAGCRNCAYYYMKGTSTFFWCMNPAARQDAGKPAKPEEKRKRGRPPGKTQKKPYTASKKKK